MPELVWLWVLLFSLFLSSLIAWRYVKGKQVNLSLIRVSIGATLARTLALFAVIYLPLINQPRISNTIALPIIGIILALSGLILMVVALRELMKTEFQAWKGIPSTLITTGPYKVLRNPINAGFISIWVGWSLTWGALYCLYLAPILIIGLVLETLWEERNLEKALGDEYKEYKGRVGMYLPKIERPKGK